MAKKIKVAQFGLGPIGCSCVQLLAEKPWLEIVGAVDIQPDLQGLPVGEVCGLENTDAGNVYQTFEELWRRVRPDVVMHTAGSKAEISFSQCGPMLEHGLAVISSCEELLFPAHRAPEKTLETEALCARTGGRILGTGVNPGFVLDVLPACLAMVTRSVSGVYGERVVNATLRRGPLQKKIGSGLKPEEFRALWNGGQAGHAGFQESLLLIAHALGWQMGGLEETLEPVLAEKEIKTDFFHVLPGQTRGLHQVVKAESTDGHKILLDLKMVLDAEEPHDLVRLDSDPPVEAYLKNGVSGDKATVAALVNAIPRVLASRPGVLLMTDIPLSAPLFATNGQTPAAQPELAAAG